MADSSDNIDWEYQAARAWIYFPDKASDASRISTGFIIEDDNQQSLSGKVCALLGLRCTRENRVALVRALQIYKASII